MAEAAHRRRYPVTGHFREGPGYFADRPRGASDWLLIYTLDGAGRFTHPSGRFTAGPHDAVLLEPAHRHRYETEPGAGHWELLWAHFVPPAAWMELLSWPAEGPGVRRVAVRAAAAREAAADRLDAAHRLARGYWFHREALAMNALGAAILWCDEQNPEGGRRVLDPRVRAAVDRICEGLEEPLDLAALAGESGLSVSRLAHLFRAEVGRSPQRFLEQQRMIRARQLLERTGDSIAEIAHQVGYGDAFYFSRRFRAHAGLAPSAYRARFGERGEKRPDRPIGGADDE